MDSLTSNCVVLMFKDIIHNLSLLDHLALLIVLKKLSPTFQMSRCSTLGCTSTLRGTTRCRSSWSRRRARGEHWATSGTPPSTACGTRSGLKDFEWNHKIHITFTNFTFISFQLPNTMKRQIL